MILDQIRFVNEQALMSTVEDIQGFLVDYLNKRATKNTAEVIRSSLVANASRIYKNTATINRLLKDDNYLQKVNALAGKNRLRGYWASRLISMPLLKTCIHQLKSAENVRDVVMGVLRLIQMVEDAEDDVRTPHKPQEIPSYGKPNYHQFYKYLLAAAGWPDADITRFSANLDFLGDKVLKKLAGQIKNNDTPRPLGW